MKHTIVAALLASTCLTTAQSAFAQETAGILDLGEIRIDASDAQSTLGNDVITEEQIEEANASSAKDLFNGESSISSGGGASIAQKVYVNGIEETLLNVTIDGARQNKSGFHHSGNVLMDPWLLKSVEVSKGLAPADVGAGALGGSIAYETKDAADLLEEGDNFGGTARLTLGTNGTGVERSVAVFGRGGNWEYLLSASRRDGDDYEDAEGSVMHNTASALSDYMGKLAYETDEGHRFEFSAGHTTDSGLRASQAGYVRTNFAGVIGRDTVLVVSDATRKSYTLSYGNTNGGNGWDPEVILSYNEQDTDAVGTYGRNTSISGSAKNPFSIANGTLTAGLDFFSESASGRDGDETIILSSRREEHQGIGLFAQARQDVTSQLSVSYGARFDMQWFEGVDQTELNDNGLSANASLDYILNDEWSVNAGVATTWGGYELGEAALINANSARVPTNYDGFGTSRAKAARLGLRYDNGLLKASAALFRTEIDNISDTSGDRGVSYDVVSTGIDTSLRYDFVDGYVSANWTYADVKEDGSDIGTFAAYRGAPAGHRIAISGAYDIREDISLGGVAQIVPSLTQDDGDKLPAYAFVNVFAAYTPASMDNLELRLDIENLFNRHYVSRSTDGIDSTRAEPIYEAGRTFTVTARLRF